MADEAAKPTVLKVAMEDGKEVEFAGKRKLLKSREVVDGKVIVRLDFRNGKVIKFTIPDSLLLEFAGHGAEQKLGDETAGVEDVDDMFLNVEELVGRLNTGEWSTKREGGGVSGTSVLLRALVESSGKTVDQVKEFLKARTPAEKIALRGSPKLKPIIDRLEAEKAAKGTTVDTDALLGQLA